MIGTLLRAIGFPSRSPRIQSASAQTFRLATSGVIASVVLAFLYINQSSQVASTGYDIRELDDTRARLEREEQRLAAQSAQLRAFGRVEGDATTRLGMVAATSPDHVRARRAPIDIDQRLRDAEARSRSQQPALDDRLARWFHLSVIRGTSGADVASPASPWPSISSIWRALAGVSPSLSRRSVGALAADGAGVPHAPTRPPQ